MKKYSINHAIDSMQRRGKIAEGLISNQNPELLGIFFTYQNEALAARKFLDDSLNNLKSGSEILEVGGGILALTIQLASEGFKVTTVEPIGEGFTEISFIMDVFMEIAREENLVFDLIQYPIEVCEFAQKFDFIFSINVMEHLKDPYTVIIQLVKNLKSGCFYRFFCPNYDFPYEPHFGKWLISRSDKAFFLPQSRAMSTLIPDKEAQRLYSSLNFLTLKKIKRALTYANIQLFADRNALFEVMNRSIFDCELQKRHKKLSTQVRFLAYLKLHYLAKLVPVNYQPIMDVKIVKSFN